MSDLQEEIAVLQNLLASHESVRAYQAAEAKIQALPDLQELSGQMKAFQQEAVLFDKIDKPNAARYAARQADDLEHNLSELPIVQDYREKMQDASDLLQYVTKTIEEKVNKELTHGPG